MTVRDLIDTLEKMPKDADVIDTTFMDIEEVKLIENGFHEEFVQLL